MNLIKCKNGHYYNAEKLETCPHCANLKVNVPVTDLLGTEQNSIDTWIPEKQIWEKYQKAGHRKLTGWLVCIAGKMEGDSFILHTGVNHIGRDTNMDIVLFCEPTVSRNNHAVITYDSATAAFLLSPNPDGTAPVLWNGHLLKSGQKITLSDHDRITLGECVLAFVPFCGEHFRWLEGD